MNKKLLLELMNISGISGNEELIRGRLLNEIKPYVDAVKVDGYGNLIGIKKGKLPKVMLAAHMDEVGFMVKSIKKNGDLLVAKVGGVHLDDCLGKKVTVEGNEGKVEGVIRKKAGKKKAKIEDIIIHTDHRVDTIVSKGILIGTYISFSEQAMINKDMIIGKALDDRIGCFVLLELARLLSKSEYEIHYVFTVQEEIGLHGATTSAFSIKPNWALAVETTPSDDQDRSTKILGGGVVVTIKDAKFIANKCINRWLVDVASAQHIPLQFNVSDKGTTDATAISLSNGGIPSAVVSVGVEKIHTPKSMASLADIQHQILLLAALMRKPPKVCVV